MRTSDAVAEREEVPTFQRRGRILFSLLAVLVFVGLAPLGTVAWKLIEVNREALTTSQQQYQLLLAASIANEVDVQIETLRHQLKREAQTLASSIRRRGDVASGEIKGILKEVAAADRFQYLRYSYFRARDVESIAVGQLEERLSPIFDEGLTNAAAALAQDLPLDAGLSDPVIIGEESSRAAIVCSAPVISGGRFRGVLSALIDIDSAWQQAAARRQTGHVIYAVDRNGRVFASTDAVKVPTGNKRVSALINRFLDGGIGGETMPYTVSRNGSEKDYLASYEVTREGWGVFVEAGLGDVYLPVRLMVESTLKWALVALAFAALVAIFFARSLSNPINQLAVASEAFARGDFSSRVAVRTRNEIGQLACTFNRMAAEMEDHIERLKRAARENNELFLGTIKALAQAIDAKDPYTRGHSVRVNRYSVILARRLGLPKHHVRDIYVASLLHDVGKIGIVDSVLNKPGKLTEEEFALMKTHPVLGANIMAPIRQMKRILPGLRWHHERMNGDGYPDGLKGEEIPLMARIIAVADTFDAVTTTRPYQPTMTFDQGHQVINNLKGASLDSKIVDAFNAAYEAGEIRPDRETAAVQAKLVGATG